MLLFIFHKAGSAVSFHPYGHTCTLCRYTLSTVYVLLDCGESRDHGYDNGDAKRRGVDKDEKLQHHDNGCGGYDGGNDV